ncbi:MAG TPA: protein-L-isoaspartate(D-aspartate) O-methyltransferase [Methanosarcinaceae archaeon]|nr:protein-L-isoaspartate(D-aspartate) O-methyltransferase [Methanosarcinaceae archaeon]
MEFGQESAKLVDNLRYQGIGKKVLDAMLLVPRHLFVPTQLRGEAYIDTPLPIGYNQTISAPHMVAIMCDLLDLGEGQNVLEVGTGSGYNAAVMAELVGRTGHVYSVERIAPLAGFAKNNLMDAGCANVTVMLEDGSGGDFPHSPYDRICVTCAAPEIPQPLIEQLKPGGLMVIPVGVASQQLYLVKKDADGTIHKEIKGGVVFVPLVGRFGFSDD